MKHLKILGVSLMAAAALMAFVGASTASATILEKESGVHMVNGEELQARLEPGTNVEFEAGFITIECQESTIKGTIKNAGGASATVSGETSALTFSQCNCEPITVTNGTLEIHWTSGGNGTLTASGFTKTAVCNTIFGKVTCKYITGNNKDLGTLTGSSSTGSTATMDINTTFTREEGSSELCNASAIWRANYVVTTPDTLNVTAS